MLIGLSLSSIALLALLGMLADLVFGEVRRWHPLVGFGRVATALEHRLNRGGCRYGRGVLAWCIAVAPPVLVAYWASRQAAQAGEWLGLGMHAALLYFCVGFRSLRDHALPIEQALRQNDLPKARALTACIVSRDTGQSDASQLAKATVESLLENGNDAVFGTLFWFIVAGGPGAVLFRLVNTLDAMWGYRNERYRAFGWMAARTDDACNWMPARLTALAYMVLGKAGPAWQCWRTQAPQWPSPNAGPVMAAGAGALGIRLGGLAIYDGVPEQRPALGLGRAANMLDIRRAWRMVAGAALLWIGVLGVAGWMERALHA